MAERCYAERFMPNVTMKPFLLSVIMLNIFMPSVMAVTYCQHTIREGKELINSYSGKGEWVEVR